VTFLETAIVVPAVLHLVAHQLQQIELRHLIAQFLADGQRQLQILQAALGIAQSEDLPHGSEQAHLEAPVTQFASQLDGGFAKLQPCGIPQVVIMPRQCGQRHHLPLAVAQIARQLQGSLDQRRPLAQLLFGLPIAHARLQEQRIHQQLWMIRQLLRQRQHRLCLLKKARRLPQQTEDARAR